MYKSSLRLIIVSLILSLIVSSIPLHAAVTADEKAILSEISSSYMISAIEQLCSDEYKGRRAGSPEHYKVVDYIESALRYDGISQLDMPGMEGYRQPLTMRYALIKSKSDIKADLSYTSSGNRRINRHFSYRGYNGSGGLNLNSEIVYVKYGIQDEESGYDDYKDLDVAGKIVLWESGAPKGLKNGKIFSGARKMLTAYKHGAIACFAVKPEELADDKGTNIGLAGPIADFPYIAVDKKIASELISGKSKSLPANLKPGTVGKKVELKITPVCDPDRKTYNVVGVIKGSDPDLADQYVMIGAHYDHIGSAGDGVIYRGADDNASGTSVVLQVAMAISASGLTPKRTIVFGFWTGEEAGLIGSSYFASNPPFALDKIISNIQIDMVGTGIPGSFMTTGASAYPEHYKYLLSSAADLKYTLIADKIAGASDHLAFSRKKVPTSLLYSSGEHKYYHTVKDTPSTMNPSVLESTARFAALSVWRAANDQR